jgi:PilX N-terminal
MRTMTMKNERGIAMVATLLVMLLFSALMVGFTTVVMSDQRYRGIDRDRTQAFYAAHGGLEKLTADLNNLFLQNVAPTQAQLDTLMASPPNMAAEGIQFLAADNSNGYTLRKPPPPNDIVSGMVSSGPYQGLVALKTRYELNSTARTRVGGEVHLLRNLETVAIPVFQFGMFSDVDLSYHAGPNFAFGGRIHSNANLFLANGNGGDGTGLSISDKVTVVRDIIRDFLVNGQPVGPGTTWPGRIQQARTPGACPAACRDLNINEGSLVDYLGSAANPIWPTLSLSTYNGYIRNGITGAKPLNLPLVGMGAQNTALVGRPPQNSNENVNNPALFGERYYSQVSLRILLSDTAADLQNLPGVTATPPESLEANWAAAPPAWYNAGVLDAAHPALARSAGVITPAVTTTLATVAGAVNVRVNTTAPFQGAIPAVPLPAIFYANGLPFRCTGSTAVAPLQLTGCTGTPAIALGVALTTPFLSSSGVPLIGGFIKIERQDPNFVWIDVTQQILGYGIAAANPSVAGCVDPSPNAIIRLQRVADIPVNPAAGGCGTAATIAPTDFWPLALFDAREALTRDVAPGVPNPTLGGVMYYVQLDVRNLSRWFNGVAPYAAGSGPGSKWNNGFSVYFSDRRNNRNGVNETGEYGFEDVVNPQTAAGTPNGIFDQGEDLNASGGLDTYGQNPSYNGAAGVPPGAAAPMGAASRPWTQVSALQAKANRPIFFRRALKLINGGLGNIVMPGLTIVAENPVYVQGDWNAAAGFPAGSATSIVGDSLTLLSNNWNDLNSFANPYNPGARVRPAQSWYRFATIAGKNRWFPHPALEPTLDFGTDGGAHNFLHMLESGGTVNYRGSIATFFYSRQATGTYKCCATVYGAPVRQFNFDVNFLTPSLLPPLTPVFRDINTLGFSQETRPGL